VSVDEIASPPSIDIAQLPAFLSGDQGLAASPIRRHTRLRALGAAGLRFALSLAAGTLLTAALLAGLMAAGLFYAPSIGDVPPADVPPADVALAEDAPPRRPPIIWPAVPLGAREDWALWSYVEKINQAWGRDWPLVIELFEDFDARYPGNPVTRDKLYVAYLEDGRVLEARGDLAGARGRYEYAARYDPNRGEAWERIAALDKRQASGR
jgi:hypothetical protein